LNLLCLGEARQVVRGIAGAAHVHLLLGVEIVAIAVAGRGILVIADAVLTIWLPTVGCGKWPAKA
jgi:hypothetical protein